MFCGFCGKKIDPEESVCPYCGQPQESRNGGNGFWDLLSPQAEPAEDSRETVRPPLEGFAEQPSPRKQAKDGRKKNSKANRGVRTIILILLVVSVALEILAFCRVNGQRTMLDNLQRSMESQQKLLEEIERENRYPTQDTQVFATMPSETDAAEADTTAAGEETGENASPAPETAAEAIGLDGQADDAFLEQPSDCVWGENNNQFEVKLQPKARVEAWQYYDKQSQQWQKIKDDDKRFEMSENAGLAILKVLENREELFTQYQCIVTDADGHTHESSVVRLQKPTDDQREKQES